MTAGEASLLCFVICSVRELLWDGSPCGASETAVVEDMSGWRKGKHGLVILLHGGMKIYACDMSEYLQYCSDCSDTGWCAQICTAKR
jgi:hypothetical protein